ncbi:tail chaperoninne [Vibrio phage vB_ValS_R12Z]|uniref:Uncharacterized protein n=6 Tax=Mardecavirus SSP002 TaxID=1921699 RepID=A0A384WK41_9CAUD|nr:hypothetical protein [Vibrio alginolyticus]YP_009598631.1 tail chaperonin [Vibrio phage SSP002]ATI19349.1 hypothetical protein KF5_039 [Vibrio phage vB_VpaS_KF5]ATI19443.1 hypothetical protein KF6_035 [Vibrio phage vB_VpaS_KF6]AUM58763.1 hypothetical protein VVP001_063 [Vibrio phage VVP001]QAY01775.1 hypothetical protein ValLY3_53 [Vibrio phage ValLY_3]QEP53408.1 hypothetical protein HCMJ_40 [Vibrio phage vB_VpaS_HCMJ]QYW05937.1 hypothetical protein [Vibrio phage vB_VpS_C2]UCW44036.1 hyp
MFWDIYRYRRVIARNDFVPWEVLERFAAKYGIEELGEFQEFCELFREMEKVYLDHLVEQYEQEQKQDQNQQGGQHGEFLGHT